MRMPIRAPLCSAFLCTALLFGANASLSLGCGGGTSSGGAGGGQACVHDRECPTGQQCAQGTCQGLPCGGCQADQACSAGGQCVTAQGATCSDGSNSCPAGYPCNGQICAESCTVDTQCDQGTVCNSNLKSCTQCAFDAQCQTVSGKAHCDAASGACAACNVNIDCTLDVGAGHLCQAHACVPGCATNNDCNASNGERCAGASGTTPGKCIQCVADSECPSQQHSCDQTGHCVQCSGATQALANAHCGLGTPECNLATSRCVQCLPENDQSGLDCGIRTDLPKAGDRDPHDAMICDQATLTCVPGCKVEAQCGCPRDASGAETNCSNPDGSLRVNQEHCDPVRTTMTGVTGTTSGACVQCRVGTNSDCYSLRGLGSVPGERCVNDACVPGCDADADCASGFLCHLGAASNDPNNHRCVQCSCAGQTTSDGWAYCADLKNCPGDSHGVSQVCDTASLLCRKKRTAETCQHSSECGDPHDPALTSNGCIPASFCAIDTGPGQFCSSSPATGRCAPACQDASTNGCGDGTHCPASTSCKQADSEAGPSATPHCVANSCNYP